MVRNLTRSNKGRICKALHKRGSKGIGALLALVVMFALLSTMASPLTTATVNFLHNPEKSNYFEGHGNITYPIMRDETGEDSFGESILAGDVNGDGRIEIVGVSLLSCTLYVYNSTLSVLWDFKFPKADEWSSLKYGKITSLALGDLDGDGIDDILFSIAPSICSIDAPMKVDTPISYLYAFKGDGTLLWNTTLSGGITQESLIITDLNGDGRNEIVAGGSDIYVLSPDGEVLSIYSLSNYPIRGVSEIIAHKNDLVFTFWHYSESKKVYSDLFRVYNSLFDMERIRFLNNSFHRIWEKPLETDEDINSPIYEKMFSKRDFSGAYISLEYISPSNPNKLVYINLTDGKIEWESKGLSTDATDIGISVIKDKVVYNAEDSIYIFDEHGRNISYYHIFEEDSHHKVRPIISVFDVDSDGRNEVVLTDADNIYAFDLITGEKEWERKLWSGPYVCPIDAPILHADTDNDGLDEIITTDPEGRIVIIDNGSPPLENQNNLLNVGMMAITGAVISGVAIGALWMWKRRRKNR